MAPAYNDGKVKTFTPRMRKKLRVLFIIILAAFVGLGIRLYLIARNNGEEYARVVLSQQEYDSKIIPYRRGDIYDRNGMILAASNKVYNVILDCSILMGKDEYLEPTLNALNSVFDLDISEVRSYIVTNPSSKYKILAKRVSYEEMLAFQDLKAESEDGDLIKGVWFEDEYVRQYPNSTLGCDIIGFTSGDNIGNFGLEQYYNSTLSGTNGREYGYLNEDSDLERTVIPAVDGYSIYSTIDINIQNTVEKYLADFNEEYKNKVNIANGAENLACIIMEVDTGNVLAMAQYPVYDLNDPRNTDALIGARQVDIDGKKTTGKPIEITSLLNANNGMIDPDAVDDTETETQEDGRDTEDQDGDTSVTAAGADGEPLLMTESLYVTEDSLRLMDDDTLYQNLNSLWKNYCINATYEPGSVSKPFTVAAALDSGSITGNEYYNCEGKLKVGDHEIKCHNTYGDGYLSVAEAIERSCNVALMHISFACGKETFLKYQHAFGFGLKTNIDLAGESRTASLVYTPSTMRQTDLATNSFGQGYNCTMIQMISAFCSLINGGNYYEPHMVSRVVTSDGSTIQNIEPRVLKQTISPSVSNTIIDYCNLVVTGEYGTGKTARPAGYMIGGKTGTAETLPRGNGEYVVSFMGYAPADDPEIAIYVVVDRPNVGTWGAQADAKYATRIVRNILTDVLPYLHIYMTEPLSDKEKAELEEKNLTDTHEFAAGASSETETMEDVSLEETPEETPAPEEVHEEPDEPWRDFAIDPDTGYAVDPNTGAYVDPQTGATIGLNENLPGGGAPLTADENDSAVGDAPDPIN
ncbi:MAG: cell division protein FtsI [Lachnospiraceae bacterium]|nr:cell division protein FtsI [Lachnospiraceae bacterium]